MTFTRPKLGAKVYLSRGPSGHTETFAREGSDRELEMYLGGKAKAHVAVEGFLRKMNLERRLEDWADVLGYLAERANLADTDLVPANVAVSFWAQVDIARNNARAEREASRHAAQGN